LNIIAIGEGEMGGAKSVKKPVSNKLLHVPKFNPINALTIKFYSCGTEVGLDVFHLRLPF